VVCVARISCRDAFSAARRLTRLACGLLTLAISASVFSSEIVPPPQDVREPISVRAEQAKRWNEGEYEVWLLHGNCVLKHGELSTHSRDAVLWIDRSDPSTGEPSKVIAYLESDVWMKGDPKPGSRQPGLELRLDKSWSGRFYTNSIVDVQATQPLDGVVPKPPLYDRGVEALGWNDNTKVQGAQFIESLPPTPSVAAIPTPRNIQFAPRSNSGGVDFKSYPGATPDERIIVGNGGLRAIVSGIGGAQGPADFAILQSGVVELEADRVVVWTDALGSLSGDGLTAAGRTEVYLEGNIVFKEGDRVVYADRMYYDMNNSRGTILNAELLTPVPQYEGLLRLKADVSGRAKSHVRPIFARRP
jgi:hypothetical protein